MNEPLEMKNAGELEGWVDRLVDGELADDQQRQLLLALEAQPDGWRRCALAFIEGQALRADLSQLCQAQPDLQQSGAAAIAHRHARPHQWTRWLAIAASLAVAFFLGISVKGWHGTSGAPPENQIAAVTTAEKSVPAKWETLKVAVPSPDGQGERTVEAPFVEGDPAKMQALLADRRPLLSEFELEALKETGHEVEQHRTFYPVQLEDGRQAVLPMDYVEVKYTGEWQ
jgi:hypothetical protein